MYASRAINTDPKPWVTPPPSLRLSDKEVKFYEPDCVIFEPRPEYDNNPNPIIVAIRSSSESLDEWSWAMEALNAFGGWSTWDAPEHPFHALAVANDDQVWHADKVISRLAALEGE